jgi:hypothetical protein
MLSLTSSRLMKHKRNQRSNSVTIAEPVLFKTFVAASPKKSMPYDNKDLMKRLVSSVCGSDDSKGSVAECDPFTD